MGDVLSKGSLFPEQLVNDLITKVRGKSSLAILSKQIPLAFNGNKEFVFSMDNEIDIVAENGKKTHGGITAEPIVIIPLKVEYGARVSDEFLYASEETQIKILEAFNDGYAKKLAKGFDLMAMHGVNPRGGEVSTVIGDNCFDKKATQTVIYDENDPEANIESAVGLVRIAEGEVSGAALDTSFATGLSKLKVNGVKQYPELTWGANPGVINGLKTDINSTVGKGTEKDKAIVGDFENMFKWGYAKEVPMEVIKYGDPDNTGKDLKGYNQVYLRAETYIGWGIFAPSHFARIKEA